MSYYRICPNCGANLDPGERCDCYQEDKKTAVIAATNDGGEMVEKATNPDSTSDYNRK